MALLDAGLPAFDGVVFLDAEVRIRVRLRLRLRLRVGVRVRVGVGVRVRVRVSGSYENSELRGAHLRLHGGRRVAEQGE